MAIGVYVPIWGLQMEEARINEWLKQEGEPVKKGEGLVVIETYKISGEVESPADGVLRRQVGKPGEDLKVGALLAVVSAPDEPDAEIERVIAEEPFVTDLKVTQPRAPQAGRTGTQKAVSPCPELSETEKTVSRDPVRGAIVRATPLARKVAKAHGIDLRNVQGSGIAGRIYRRDLEALTTSSPATATLVATDKVVPLSTLRRAIIEKTMQTVNIPYGALSRKVRADNLLSFKDTMAAAFQRKHGMKLTLTHLFFKAAALALEQVPILNATLSGDNIVMKGSINLGMVVTPSSGGGIMIPVLKDVLSKSLGQIAAEWSAMVERVKAGSLSFDDLSGGTFTISNVGALGIDVFTPLIHPPEAGILGISRIREEPIVQDGQIVPGRVLDLIVGADHRVFDADPIGVFLTTLDGLLQNPGEMLL